MTDVRATRSPFGEGRWRLWLWGAIAGLLLLPLVAMRFTREVAWDGADFLWAGLLLGGAGLAFELAVRLLRRPAWRWLAGAAILGAVLVIWADAAVGIF